MRAVVLVGGFGTRLRPLTLHTPKQMLPVVGRPMIERVVGWLAAHGVVVEKRPGGYLVPLAQPLRGLINILLDEQTPPSPIVAARRLADCSATAPGRRQLERRAGSI